MEEKSKVKSEKWNWNISPKSVFSGTLQSSVALRRGFLWKMGYGIENVNLCCHYVLTVVHFSSGFELAVRIKPQ